MLSQMLVDREVSSLHFAMTSQEVSKIKHRVHRNRQPPFLSLTKFLAFFIPLSVFSSVLQVLAGANHNFLLTERRRHYLRYMGGLSYFEVGVRAKLYGGARPQVGGVA